jgi:prefoldin subunit 5
VTREALGFAVRIERQADMITSEIEDLKRELDQVAQWATNLRKRAEALRSRVQVKEPERA